MSTFDRTRQAALLVAIFLIMTSLTACTLSARTPSPEQGVTTPAAPGEGGIPPSVLTEVAATLYAPLQNTPSDAAVPPQAAAPGTPTPALEQPLPTDATAVSEAPPTTAATEASPAAPAATESQPYPAPTNPPAANPPAVMTSVVIPGLLTPTAGPSSGFQPPATYAPVFPPSAYAPQTGRAVTIAGVNLPACGGAFTANFLIINQSGLAFESASIQLNDVSSGLVLPTSIISDAPFMTDDRVCYPGGISRLESGYALFAGASLGTGRLSGHTIQANMLFCSNNNLGGRCFPQSVEFVVP